MSELVLFYYLSWFLVIFIFFFMDQSSTTKILQFFILLFICISPYYILFDSIYISLSYMLLFISTIYLFGLSIVKLETMFITFMCMIAYVGMLLWEKLIPILFFMPSKLLIGILITLFIHFLLRDLTSQIIIIVIGFAWGQLIYEIILIYYGLGVTVGSYEYTNYLSFSIVTLVISKSLFQTVKKVIIYTKMQFKTDV